MPTGIIKALLFIFVVTAIPNDYHSNSDQIARLVHWDQCLNLPKNPTSLLESCQDFVDDDGLFLRE
jgi:hypothetical protein